MKARVKATGEIVDVTNLFDDGTAEIGENTYMKVSQIDMDLDGTEGFDMLSEQRMRYELIKLIIPPYMRNERRAFDSNSQIAYSIVDIVDEIIKQLKETEE